MSPEGIDLQLLAEDRDMDRKELGKGEGTGIEQSFGIRCFAVALLEFGHRESHDLVLAVGEPLLARHPRSMIPDPSQHEVRSARY